MQVTIVTFGSRGDVQPFVHLAMAFRTAGYAVRLCTQQAFESLAANSGVEFVALSGSDPATAQETDYARRPRTKLGVLWRVLRRDTRPAWDKLEELESAVADSDLLICNHLADSAYHLAEKHGIQCAFAYLHPTHPTRSFPSTVLPQSFMAPGAFNLFTHRALRHLYWLKNRQWINEWRTRRLGLRSVSVLGPFRTQYIKRVPYLFAFSPRLLPAISDWPHWYRMTGYWFNPGSGDEEVPANLRSFIESGDPPAVIAFGSVASPDLPRIIDEAAGGIRQAGQRLVIVTGWGKHTRESDSDVLVIPCAPYRWLFARAHVVIHAAGSGTVAEISRAGVPSIPIPFAAEQRFWAHRLWKLGVAVRPIPPNGVNRQAILSALRGIAAQAGMRQRAGQLADRIRTERGAKEAVDFLTARMGSKIAHREMPDRAALPLGAAPR